MTLDRDTGVDAGAAPRAPAVFDRLRARLAADAPRRFGEVAAREVLQDLGLPFPRMQVASSAHAAVAAASAIGLPVALKLVSDDVLHKSDHGLVCLDLESSGAVAAAFGRLLERSQQLVAVAPGAGVTGSAAVAVQAMAPPGLELFVGMERDAVFGPLLVFGMGGTRVELYRDVGYALPPLTTDRALRILRRLRSFPLLDGFRGGPRYELSAVLDLLVGIGELCIRVPEIHELDLNPVRIYPDGRLLVLDTRLVTRPAPQPVVRVHDDGQARAAIRRLLNPASVAVVGASRTPTKPGGQVLRYLRRHGYPGRIFPINASGEPIDGLETFRSVDQLPSVPDLACVALPAEAVPDALSACGAAGIPVALVLASGFAEVGDAGAARQRELITRARQTGIRLCGPNTIGVASAVFDTALSFSGGLEVDHLIKGSVALISQSGAIGGSLISRHLQRGYGFSHWVTVGNEADLDTSDYLEFMIDDPSTRSIALFLEGIADAERYRAALRHARAVAKPVVVCKSGSSEVGRRAVASHSGMLAGRDEVYAALFDQELVTRVREVTALLEVSTTLADRRPRGRRVAIVTTSGGAGSLTADLLAQAGVHMAELSPDTRRALKAILPAFATIANPLDLTAQGTFIRGAIHTSIELLLDQPDVDAVLVVITSVGGSEAERIAGELIAARDLVEARQPGAGRSPAADGDIADGDDRAWSPKPVLVAWLIAPALAQAAQRLLAGHAIPVFEDPARMVAALRAAVHYTEHAGATA